VILTENVNGTICRIKYADINVIDQNDEHVWIDVGAGKNWHELVLEALEQGWFGLENLSLIPGSVGAAPVQNIGAYGVEVADLIDSVEVLQRDGSVQRLTREQCCFGYRDSYFKNPVNLAKGLCCQIIVSVRLRLSCRPQINVSYAELAQALGVGAAKAPSRRLPSPQEVSRAVIEIRQRKLPDPDDYPNAGSFFKNPIVDQKDAERLQGLGLSPYAFKDNFKVSAAQLIDMAGWKRARRGDVGCWSKQPLVFVNYGSATAPEVLDFASTVQGSVRSLFQVELELEPSVVF
jgi:UDP-N-acetylmuramate dehydrogenase